MEYARMVRKFCVLQDIIQLYKHTLFSVYLKNKHTLACVKYELILRFLSLPQRCYFIYCCPGENRVTHFLKKKYFTLKGSEQTLNCVALQPSGFA